MQGMTEADPIWGMPASEQTSGLRDARTWFSHRNGGMFSVSGTALAGELTRLSPEKKAMLTTWLVDQRRAGKNDPLVTTSVIEELKGRRPLSLPAKRERFLWMLAVNGASFDLTMKVSGGVDQRYYADRGMIAAWCELKSEDELQGFIRYLVQAGLIDRPSDWLSLTARGFDELDALSRSSALSTQAFVAMWFSDEMQDAYDSGFSTAISQAGYLPLRIDVKEHNNKIDDEIVLEIRRSRFVVADFTCPVFPVVGEPEPKRKAEVRGGVYFEAGLAQGLGIDVIWTVRADRLDYVHFDTRQYAHIVWSDPADLQNMLYKRIGATIGLRS